MSYMGVYDGLKIVFPSLIILSTPITCVHHLCLVSPRRRSLEFCPMLLLSTAVVCTYLCRLTLNNDGVDQQWPVIFRSAQNACILVVLLWAIVVRWELLWRRIRDIERYFCKGKTIDVNYSTSSQDCFC